MPSLTILPIDKKIDAAPGAMLLDALRETGIEIPAPCNGKQLCGKCKVRIYPAPPLETLNGHLTKEEVKGGIRLACQTAVREDMQVTLPDDYSQNMRILAGEGMGKARSAPAVKVTEIRGKSFLVYRSRQPTPLNAWRPGFSPKGLAVDLGTTTLAASLIDLRTGGDLATATTVNPQVRFGHDVMTRIHYGSTGDGLVKLTALISEGLNALVERMCNEAGAHPHEIVDAVIGGNTTMLQIAAGIDPAPLGVAPFTVGIRSGQTYPAAQFRLALNPQACVYIPPVIQAFVGSDISAGLLKTNFFNQKGPLLFIDIGTNGEMALIADSRRIVTSTAAGPAFEGMGVSCGMPAISGAIEIVWTDGEYLGIRTIDDAPPQGLCGSGIMDVMAGLIRLGAVEPGGRLKNPFKDKVRRNPFSDRYEILERTAAVKLADNVYFTQKDIRQFQLAKSAIRTGVDLLLAAGGATHEQLKKIIIAGAFGYNLRTESLRQVGVIPAEFDGEIEFAGNTSLTGCARMLADAETRDVLQDQMHSVTHLSIAKSPDFQTRFLKNISLAG